MLGALAVPDIAEPQGQTWMLSALKSTETTIMICIVFLLWYLFPKLEGRHLPSLLAYQAEIQRLMLRQVPLLQSSAPATCNSLTT